MSSNSKRRRSRRRKKAFKATVSKIEQAVGDALRSLRYKFVAQYAVFSTTGRCRGIFDFYHEKKRVAIEVNGTYWHSDPREYPDGPVYKTQRRAMKSWNKKVKYAEKIGVRIIILWEKDLQEAQDLKAYIKQVLKEQL